MISLNRGLRKIRKINCFSILVSQGRMLEYYKNFNFSISYQFKSFHYSTTSKQNFEEKSQEIFRDADEMVKKQNFGDLINYLDEFLSSHDKEKSTDLLKSNELRIKIANYFLDLNLLEKTLNILENPDFNLKTINSKFPNVKSIKYSAYKKLNDTGKLREFLNDLKTISKSNENILDLIETNFLIADIYSELEDYNESENYLKEIESLSKEKSLQNQIVLSKIFYRRGLIYTKTQEYDKALQNFNL